MSITPPLLKIKSQSGRRLLKNILIMYFRTRSRTDSFTSSDLNDLKFKILASHNHNCSDNHLQSHVNAELALSSRKPKVREAEMKNTECHFSVKNDSHTRFDVRKDVSKDTQNNTCNHLSFPNSPCSGSKLHSRSSSFSEKRLTLEKIPKIGTQCISNSNLSSRWYKSESVSSQKQTPRVTKSDTHYETSGLPLLIQINEPSSNNGELRLKVRSLNGGAVYLIHISADDTVARLYQILNKTLMKTRSPLTKFHIITNGYESKRLDHLQKTLKEYGITRDSVLHLVNG